MRKKTTITIKEILDDIPSSYFVIPLLGTKINLFVKNPVKDTRPDNLIKIISELKSFNSDYFKLVNFLRIIFKNLNKELTEYFNSEIIFKNNFNYENYLNFVNNFNNFINGIFLGDIYFLISSFYSNIVLNKNEIKYLGQEEVKCVYCENTFKININLEKIFTSNYFLKIIPCQDLFCYKKHYEKFIKEKDGKKIEIIFSLPSLGKYFQTNFKFLKNNNLSNLISEGELILFFISEIKINEKIKISNFWEIKEFIDKLPAKFFSEILNFYKKNVIGKYFPIPIQEVICPECGNNMKLYIDLIDRMHPNIMVNKLINKYNEKLEYFIRMHNASKLNFSETLNFMSIPAPLLDRIVSREEELLEKEIQEYEKLKRELEKKK